MEKATRSITKQVTKRVNNTLSSAAKRQRVDSEEHELDTDTDPLDDEMQEASPDHQVHPVASRDRADKRPSMETEGSSFHLFDDNNVCCVCFRTNEGDLEEDT